MPEGDTIFRLAAVLRPVMVGQQVVEAEARSPGPRVSAIVGATVADVRAQGKHLFMSFDNGLVLHSHMGMQGRWRTVPRARPVRPGHAARVVLRLPGVQVVCFDAPTIELVREKTLAVHPGVATLGPDLLGAEFDVELAMRNLRDPSREEMPISDALMDQRALAGIGNVYKSEVLFIERVHPDTPVRAVDDAALRRLVKQARALLFANRGTFVRRTTGAPAGEGPGRLWVYGRTGRRCARCGSVVRSKRRAPLVRTTYWCPGCQI